MLVFLSCDFIPSISFVHIRALERQKNNSFMDIFSLWCIFCFYFSLLFSYSPPLLSSMFIASDSKLPYNNPVMIAAMIPTSMRPFKQAQR